MRVIYEDTRVSPATAQKRRDRLAAVLRGYLTARRAHAQTVNQVRAAGKDLEHSRHVDKIVKSFNRVATIGGRFNALNRAISKRGKAWASRSSYQVSHVAHRPKQGPLSRPRLDTSTRPANPKTYGLRERKERSGYKIDRETFDGTHMGQYNRYDFTKDRGKRGSVIISHSPKSRHSTVDFYAKNNDRPDHRDAHAIMKTVEKAVRHHLRTVKPATVDFTAMADHRDAQRWSGDETRRGKLFHRLAKRILARHKQAKVLLSGPSSMTVSLDGN